MPEAALSLRVFLLCGEYAVSWPFFVSIKEACRDIAREIHGGHRIYYGPITHFSSLRENNGDQSLQTMGLIDTLKLIDIVNVTDERDRLYALFGLNSTLARLAGPPNYIITPFEVWHRFFQSIISSLEPDSCLLWQIISHYVGALPKTTFPLWMLSWMPDFSSGPPARNRKFLTSRPLLHQCCQESTSAESPCADETDPFKLSPSLDGSSWTLSCQAIFIDVLVEDVFPNLQDGLRYDSEAQARIRTYEYFSSSESFGILFSIVGDRNSRYPGLDTALPFGNAEQWGCMSLFTMTLGKLAVASRHARAGDYVAFFMGNSCSGQLSVVRRDKTGTFRYKNTGFVSGWMAPKVDATSYETL